MFYMLDKCYNDLNDFMFGLLFMKDLLTFCKRSFFLSSIFNCDDDFIPYSSYY